MPKVESSMIDFVEWKQEGISGLGLLDVKFKTGDTYQYEGVPEFMYDGMLKADSVGKYFDTYIKKGAFTYKKLGPPTEREKLIQDAISLMMQHRIEIEKTIEELKKLLMMGKGE